jgi:pimeloyl-ACP methyl ester carboxylesterase
VSTITHRFIETNGIRLHLAEQGTGPLVVFLHGFPECWYSWRHQLAALAGAGYRAVAPDQRGFGETDRPGTVEDYTILHTLGDLIGVLDALGEERAVVVGHDFGSRPAWTGGLVRPDRIRSVVGLSVPFVPRGPVAPIAGLRATMGERFYQVYFQQPGPAEVEFERDVRTTIRKLLYGLSGDVPDVPTPVVPEVGELLDIFDNPAVLPPWLNEEDLDVYERAFSRTGFSSALNWARNFDRNWELMAPWAGAKVEVPALFVSGERDHVGHFPGMGELIANLQEFVPKLTRTIILPGCGHWTQQERADEVNAAVVGFLEDLPP